MFPYISASQKRVCSTFTCVRAAGIRAKRGGRCAAINRCWCPLPLFPPRRLGQALIGDNAIPFVRQNVPGKGWRDGGVVEFVRQAGIRIRAAGICFVAAPVAAEIPHCVAPLASNQTLSGWPNTTPFCKAAVAASGLLERIVNSAGNGGGGVPCRSHVFIGYGVG